MTAQTPRASALEAAMQAAVGVPIGFSVCFAVGKLGLSPTLSAALITVVMFLVSTARGYLIRRGFDRRSLAEAERAR
jgi:uncharacterized membrane protein AbrB (regulator of aidB expression)